MKTIITISLSIIFSMNYFAQIKIDAKKLAKGKDILKAVTTTDTVKPNTSQNVILNNNNSTNSNNTATKPMNTNGATKNNTAGWSMDDLDNISTTNAYFGSGWTLDKFSPRSGYNSTLTIPVVEAFYWNYCFKQPFRMRVFKFSDKDALIKYDFEAEAAGENQNGRYKQEMIITDNNKFIIILSYFEKAEPELDKYMSDAIPDLKRRLPSAHW